MCSLAIILLMVCLCLVFGACSAESGELQDRLTQNPRHIRLVPHSPRRRLALEHLRYLVVVRFSYFSDFPVLLDQWCIYILKSHVNLLGKRFWLMRCARGKIKSCHTCIVTYLDIVYTKAFLPLLPSHECLCSCFIHVPYHLYSYNSSICTWYRYDIDPPLLEYLRLHAPQFRPLTVFCFGWPNVAQSKLILLNTLRLSLFMGFMWLNTSTSMI